MDMTPELLKLYVQPYVDKIKLLEEENAKLKADGIRPYRSEQCNELFAALSKAQAEYTVAFPNRQTRYYGTDYEDLDVIVQAARPGLKKYTLSFNQQEILYPDGSKVICSLLGHESGQWMESRSRVISAKDDPLTYGSALGFAKRQSAACLLGVTIKEDPMDDNADRARAETQKIFAKGTAFNANYDPKEESYERISKGELEELEYELGDHVDLIKDIYKNYKIESLADLPKSKYRDARNHLVRIKNLRSGIK